MTVVLSLSSSEMWLQEDNLKLVTATDDFGLTGQGTSLQPDVNPSYVRSSEPGSSHTPPWWVFASTPQLPKQPRVTLEKVTVVTG